ncbi:MAG: Jag N-terminal domain-containing protein [Caldilineaceae bacterium]|nr:Jag N-terminal domain-containing protein [Caldilineaceae bacterium]
MVEQSQEFSAKTVDAAIDEGVRHLGLNRNQVDIEILHEGSRGLLGIGSTNARVRITPRPAPAPKPPAPPVATPAPAPPPAPAPSPVPAVVAEKTQETEESDDDDAPLVTPDRDTGDRDNGDEDDETYDDSDLDPAEVVALASDLLLEMVSLMGLNAQVEGSQRQEPDEKESSIYLNLVGDGLGSLIGRHGETLSSMQYLVRLMVNQKLHRWTNIVVDVDGYKDRRSEKLAQMALRMAAQVVETGRPVALEPMPASERRLIHIALRGHPQVYTESIGEDTRRKIQILLK